MTMVSRLEKKLCRDEMVDMLKQQPDFLAQESWLTEICHVAGHEIIYLPKYHCEFNWIERYWGAVKRYTRAHCDYSFTSLPNTMNEGFRSVSINDMRRYARKAYRYIDAYRARNGVNLSVRQVEWAIKKYKSHRRIFDTDEFHEASRQ